MYSTVRVMVCGHIGKAVRVKRGNLFSYSGELTELAERDYPLALYAELTEHFTTTCDWVLFMSVCTGKLDDVHFIVLVMLS